jgi:acetate kinase
MRPERQAMKSEPSAESRRILTINGGSSSVKFALFDAGSLRRVLSGTIEGIGQAGASLAVSPGGGPASERSQIDAPDHARATERFIDWLVSHDALPHVQGVGHRVVHGGIDVVEHRRITADLVQTFENSVALDPAHLPQEIAMIDAISKLLPDVPQVACLDTAFHRDLPRVAQLLPIPRAYVDAGIRRLGFHGLSYTYLRDELRRIAPREAEARVILAHLGSGASLAAMRHGKPVDTTMGFTPTGGLVMGTRPGDLDPGLLVHLMRSEKASADAMDTLVNERCGLRGVSDTTSDMQALLERRAADPRAAEAVELFCYQAVKWIGAFAAALGGLDTLVFSGGIGERSAVIRREICSQIGFLNVILDGASNEVHGAVVSDARSTVTVRVIPTDEEIVIARTVRKILEEP